MVDDVQQNQGTQGHGQGYLGSLKALTPELIQEVTIINGPFSAEVRRFQRPGRGANTPAGVAAGRAHPARGGRQLRIPAAPFWPTARMFRPSIPTLPMTHSYSNGPVPESSATAATM